MKTLVLLGLGAAGVVAAIRVRQILTAAEHEKARYDFYKAAAEAIGRPIKDWTTNDLARVNRAWEAWLRSCVKPSVADAIEWTRG